MCPLAYFHGVRFYESTESMAATTAVFLAGGFIVDEAALVIERPEHRSAVDDALRGISFNLVALRTSGRLRFLDAARTLREVMVNSVPDPVRFATVVDGEIRRLDQGGRRRVRVYDEMTDVLWKQGDHGSALRLEALWARTMGCSILCGHGTVPGSDRSALDSLCEAHTHIVAPDGAPHPINRLSAAIGGKSR